MSALRQKMIEDMQIRNYSPHTIEAYVRCVAHFAGHFGKSPDLLTPAHVREYQLFLVQQREDCWGTLVQTVCALRFFYQQTLGRKWMIDFIPYPKRVKKLPLILSQEKAHALLKAATDLKHHTILATIYATGLRVSEAAALLVSDIDSGRQTIAVRQGKGRKDRFVNGIRLSQHRRQIVGLSRLHTFVEQAAAKYQADLKKHDSLYACPKCGAKFKGDGKILAACEQGHVMDAAVAASLYYLKQIPEVARISAEPLEIPAHLGRYLRLMVPSETSIRGAASH
jgi:site-specific recombinase XerD